MAEQQEMVGVERAAERTVERKADEKEAEAIERERAFELEKLRLRFE